MAWQPVRNARTGVLILIWVALCTLPSPLAADSNTEEHLNLILMDQKGIKVKLADITANKPSLIYFWATWCKPCRKVTPKVADLSKKYHGRMQVVGISVGGMDSIQKIEKYRIRYQLEYPLFLDLDNQALKVFTIIAIPAFVFLDPSGKILYSGIGLPRDLEQLLEG
jgi:thiol-disulfide isomerase/thioredoxin